MSQFDESKIRRDGEGKFAPKGPAAEATGVDLGSFTPSDVSPEDFGLPEDKDYTPRFSPCPRCGEQTGGHIGGGTKLPGTTCPHCKDRAPDLVRDDGEVTTIVDHEGVVSRMESESGEVFETVTPHEAGWDEDIDSFGADPEAVRAALQENDPDYQAAMDEMAQASHEQMMAEMESADPPAQTIRNDKAGATTYLDADGQIHNDSGPAWKHDRGAFVHARHGVVHRDSREGAAMAGYEGHDGRPSGSPYEGRMAWIENGKPFREGPFPAVRHEDGKMEFYSAPGERDEQGVPPLFARRTEDESLVIRPDSMRVVGRHIEDEARYHELHSTEEGEMTDRSVAVDEALRMNTVQYALRNGVTQRERKEIEKQILGEAIHKHQARGARTADPAVRGYAFAASTLTGGESRDTYEYENNVSNALKLGKAQTPAQLAKIANTRGWSDSFEVRNELYQRERELKQAW